MTPAAEQCASHGTDYDRTCPRCRYLLKQRQRPVTVFARAEAFARRNSLVSVVTVEPTTAAERHFKPAAPYLEAFALEEVQAVAAREKFLVEEAQRNGLRAQDLAAARSRICRALRLADAFSQIDGAHHKAWVIDQMVRALTGCDVVEAVGDFEVLGESDEYREFVRAHKEGEDGPETYGWEEGIAP